MLEINRIYNMDCLEGMKNINDKSIDLILCDLPYGTTASKWDKVISFTKLWSEYMRIIKDEGVIALTANASFTNKLINSNEKYYKYKWIWIKNTKTNFVNAKNRPLTQYEEILIFSKGNTANGSKIKMNYYPQGIIRVDKVMKAGKNRFGTVAGVRPSHKSEFIREYTNYPSDVLYFNKDKTNLHPNQKPLELFEYLVKTYTKENNIVLDNCIGSGTTAVACINTDRNYIGFEIEKKYYDIAEKRIRESLEEKEKLSSVEPGAQPRIGVPVYISATAPSNTDGLWVVPPET